MSRPVIKRLNVVLGVGNGTPLPDVERCVSHTVQVFGTFTADLRIEASNDGVTWAELASFTGAGITVFEYEPVFKSMRVRTAAFTSQVGLQVYYGGFDTRADP